MVHGSVTHLLGLLGPMGTERGSGWSFLAASEPLHARVKALCEAQSNLSIADVSWLPCPRGCEYDAALV